MDENSDPLPEMANLVDIAKTTLSYTAQAGEFFFPKLLVGKADGMIQVCQTDTSAEAFVEALTMYSTESKLDWLAFTSDSYQFKGDVTKPEDQRVYRARIEGLVTMQELFEAGDDRVTEAISIILAQRVTTPEGDTVKLESVFVPYHRLPGNRIRYGDVGPAEEELGRYGATMAEAIMVS